MRSLRREFVEAEREAYLAGLTKAMSFIEEQREEEEGGEAACALREVVALDNAKYLIEEYVRKFRANDDEPIDERHMWWKDLLYNITNVTPLKTPLVSMAPKVRASSVAHEWVMDDMTLDTTVGWWWRRPYGWLLQLLSNLPFGKGQKA